ncbi:MAG: hypothetical protein Q7S00_03405 [bacterium]|nr:hypothetical protein [bacterium]
MRTSIRRVLLYGLLVLFLGLPRCGGQGLRETLDSLNLQGGTETGTTDAAGANGENGSTENGQEASPSSPTSSSLLNLGVDLQAVGSAIIPNIKESAADDPEPLSGLSALVIDPEDDWQVYLDSDGLWLLTDIFGDPREDPYVVTKTRVLLDSFRRRIDGIFSRDSSLSCQEGELLLEQNELEIPFYGTVQNGTEENRYFDCYKKTVDDRPSRSYRYSQTTLYGRAEDQTIRVVIIAESIELYDKSYDTKYYQEARGDRVSGLDITYATFTEIEGEDGDRVGYLDLQYAQATIYNGTDGLFQTDDDLTFKSRSRITGTAFLDGVGEASSGLGEFTITKFDSSPDFDTIVTQTAGRGDYGEKGTSLFKINSSSQWQIDGASLFCIQQRDQGLPIYASPSDCASLEILHPWNNNDFPFLLDPPLEQVFDEKILFEGNDTDLIRNDGKNFIIPEYKHLKTSSTSP